MMRPTLLACLGLLALAGCVETPPYTVVSSSVPPPNGAYAGTAAMPAPPLASRMTNVTASHVTQVPGTTNCTDYAVTGTLDGAVRTVTGRSCRLQDGGLQVTERNPLTGQLSTTAYPPPQAQSTATTYGTAVPYTYAAPYAYGYPYGYGYGPGFGYGYGYGYPFFGDPFFFGYPFGFGFGFGGFYGHGGYGFRGGYGGFRGGYGGGFHGGGGGGFHGGGGGGGGHR